MAAKYSFSDFSSSWCEGLNMAVIQVFSACMYPYWSFSLLRYLLASLASVNCSGIENIIVW